MISVTYVATEDNLSFLFLFEIKVCPCFMKGRRSSVTEIKSNRNFLGLHTAVSYKS